MKPSENALDEKSLEIQIAKALDGPGFRPAVLFALALGTFAVGTEGFMIAALLPTMARSLAVSVQATGQLVTIFALVYAVSSPVLTALSSTFSRRSLLMSSLLAFAAANLVAAVAPGYWSLVGARVLLAIAAGLYVPNANAVAGAIVSPAYRGRALAIVNGGITTAVALGVPLGAIIGTHFGWRASFVGVAVLSIVALAGLAVMLPGDIEAAPPATLGQRLAIAARPAALLPLGVTALWGVAAYEVYTYVSPYLIAATDVTPSQVGFLLTLLGFSAIGGVTLGGYATDHWGVRRVQAISLPAMAVAFAGLTLASLSLAPHALAAVIPLIILWGLSAWSFFPAQQHRLIEVGGIGHTAVILSLNASFMYVGFSIGAAIGSLVITFASVAWIGAVGAACVIAAIALSRVAERHDGRVKPQL